MSDDIKARLRNSTWRMSAQAMIAKQSVWEYHYTACMQAADHIEALEAEVARLRVRVKDITIVAERALNEWEGLIEDELVGEMYDECMKDVAEVRAALSQDNPTRDQGAGDQAANAE